LSTKACHSGAKLVILIPRIFRENTPWNFVFSDSGCIEPYNN